MGLKHNIGTGIVHRLSSDAAGSATSSCTYQKLLVEQRADIIKKRVLALELKIKKKYLHLELDCKVYLNPKPSSLLCGHRSRCAPEPRLCASIHTWSCGSAPPPPFPYWLPGCDLAVAPGSSLLPGEPTASSLLWEQPSTCATKPWLCVSIDIGSAPLPPFQLLT